MRIYRILHICAYILLLTPLNSIKPDKDDESDPKELLRLNAVWL